MSVYLVQLLLLMLLFTAVMRCYLAMPLGLYVEFRFIVNVWSSKAVSRTFVQHGGTDSLCHNGVQLL